MTNDEAGYTFRCLSNRVNFVILMSSLHSLGSHLGTGFVSQRGGKVALAGGAGDGDDELASVFRALGHFDGGKDVGTGADADEDAFLLGQAARHGESSVVADFDTLGDLRVAGAVLEMKVGWNESGTSALNLCADRAARAVRRGSD